MGAVLSEIIDLLVGGVTGLATGIGAGLNEMATSAFLVVTETGTTLSTFGGLVAVFGGIALAIGLTTLVTRWLMSLGN